MRNFLGNRWGKIGLMLFVCFAVHGFIAASSYAELCCQCVNSLFYSQGSYPDCSSMCSATGQSNSTGVSYTLHTGMNCNDECSDDAGYCFRLNQSLCDRDTNKEDLCSADTDPNTRKCGVFAFGTAIFPETGWTPCNAGEYCFYKNVSDSWDNTAKRTTTDADDQCASVLYAK